MPDPAFIHRCGPGPCKDCRLKSAEKEVARLKKRLYSIRRVILDVEDRCMAADGPVTPTLQEMTEDELRQIWLLAGNDGRTKWELYT